MNEHSNVSTFVRALMCMTHCSGMQILHQSNVLYICLYFTVCRILPVCDFFVNTLHVFHMDQSGLGEEVACLLQNPSNIHQLEKIPGIFNLFHMKLY